VRGLAVCARKTGTNVEVGDLIFFCQEMSSRNRSEKCERYKERHPRCWILEVRMEEEKMNDESK